MPSTILSDNGVTSNTSGIKVAGSNDGILELQTTTAGGTATAAITIDTAQRSKFPTTIGVGGATPATSGSGISFPATESASSDANTLDDYEEGTWTPVLGGSTSETGQTYTRQLGQYTKVGRQVTVTWDVIISNVGTMVGNGHLKGLPFTVNSTNQGYRAGLALGEFSNLATAVSIFSGIVVENTTELYIRVATASTATGVASITATSLWGNGTQVIGTITYFV
jgi:hypothetical protein